ncbi:MAG TPA: UDP-N-acetylmuramate--L-alanine ligase [Anaerolineales bacterium]|nr:UDP-N-acetylmuramate--L-alanine ligase [Anaerolineales bacterium]
MLTRRVHFIGIGGTGLSAIAVVLLERGLEVSGSDKHASPVLTRLQQAGARIMFTHHADNVQGADVVVRSSAVSDDNIEVQAAKIAGIPVLKRSEFLEQLLADTKTIAVAGSHGKTTTTAMIAWMLHQLGLDPSYIIGSTSINLASNAHAGTGEYFVIEADEYDGMFLGLAPTVAIVTNVEHDHPDCYPTQHSYQQAFREFVQKIVPAGVLVACQDDPGAAHLAGEFRKQGGKSLVYGLNSSNLDYSARDLSLNASGSYDFTMFARDGEETAQVALQVPGIHNVRNALAALSVAEILELPLSQSAQALGAFRGTGRRFEVRGEPGGVVVIDDYAHHPSEIRTTLEAARTRYRNRRIWAVWQPHTFSRTRMLRTEFCMSFESVDRVIVTEIYAAREEAPQDGFSSLSLVQEMRQHQRMAEKTVDFAATLEEAKRLLQQNLKHGDVVIVLSAGDANRISDELIENPAWVRA